jgi:uncharacterized protein YjiK
MRLHFLLLPLMIHTSLIAGPAFSSEFTYDLSKPDSLYVLPKSLTEASAVAFINDDEVALLQDERGYIYIYSLVKSEITDRIKFAGKGDFEGLSIRDNTAYALKSNGIIYEITNYRDDSIETNRFRTVLGSGDDTEGLSLDSTSSQLLIIGKEPPRINKKRKDKKRAIYIKKLGTDNMDNDPYLLIDMESLKDIYIDQSNDEAILKRAKKFKPESKGDFKPSDLAVHPTSGLIYIISAQGSQLLIVIDREANIKYVREMSNEHLRQIEGIDFSPSGDMYIVSEGDGKQAVLAVYKNK